ncbi:MAG: tyrosine-type recombinase/integrase [Lachnospiraceae bacterium]|nr:tyrosine-type recombinase/integrase [Lachnospiraceae bacterium]
MKKNKRNEVRLVNSNAVLRFEEELRREEKTGSTIDKYKRDVRHLESWLSGRPVTKELMIQYKAFLLEDSKSLNSINSYIVSANKFLVVMGWGDLKVRVYKIQQETAQPEEKQLTVREYKRLLMAAKRLVNELLYLILEVLASTGMRISELRFLTAEAVREGVIVVNNKGKIRRILLTARMQEQLNRYMRMRGIATGVIFTDRSGKAVSRVRIWREMKKLCDAAGVDERKVYPHNLRKLFATELYDSTKDIARVAEVLGHSSVETTRRYILPNYKTRRIELERLGLVGEGFERIETYS